MYSCKFGGLCVLPAYLIVILPRPRRKTLCYRLPKVQTSIALPKPLTFTYARLRNSRLGGRRVLRPTVLLLPCLMSPQQQGFDCLPVLAGAQFIVSPAVLDVD